MSLPIGVPVCWSVETAESECVTARCAKFFLDLAWPKSIVVRATRQPGQHSFAFHCNKFTLGQLGHNDQLGSRDKVSGRRDRGPVSKHLVDMKLGAPAYKQDL